MRQIDFLSQAMTPFQRAMMAARGLLRSYVLRTSQQPIGWTLHLYEREAERAQKLAGRDT